MTRLARRTAPALAPAPRQRSTVRPVSRPHDPAEREADRAADAVERGASVRGWSFASVPVAASSPVHRDEIGSPKTDDEKKTAALGAAASKAGEVVLATEGGKALKKKVLANPVVKTVKDAVTSPVGIVSTVGAGVAGVAALAAAGKELPVQPPAIPLDAIAPGLSANVTVKTRSDAPKQVGVSITYSPPAAAPKGPKKSATEIQREETARMAADQERFRRGLHYAEGSKEAEQQRQEDAAIARLISPHSPLPTLFVPLAPASETKDEASPIQKEPASTVDAGPTHAAVDQAVTGPGHPLEPTVRRSMEARFGYDFSSVRVHDDGQAAAATSAIDAAAFTLGEHVAFAPGRYDPSSPAGRHLLAHELAHVVQQHDLPPAGRVVQRRSIFESIAIFFGAEGSFDDAELLAYLTKVTAAHKIGDSYDSDNMAREIVRRWKAGNARYRLLPEQKVLLINEMLSGPTLGGDEEGILALLEGSPDGDLKVMLAPGKVSVTELESDVDGDNRKRLDRFFATRFKGGRDQVVAGHIEFPDEAAAPMEATHPDDARRKDYVFVMGEDRKGTSNLFFTEAVKFYEAKLPAADLLRDKRSLAEVLEYVRDQVTAPIGTVYLVSHANEDGTLSFGLDRAAAAADPHLTVKELRDALRAPGGSTLPDVRNKIDPTTRIEIKGCDLGRTTEMVELIDEAFGGAGQVTAGTHEQVYLQDPVLGTRADAAFRAKIAARHPTTSAVDPTLTGAARKKAQAERARNEAQRKKDLASDLKAHADEERKVVEEASMVEAVSGPLFQRPGSSRFSVAELQAEVDATYGHLDKSQRARLARDLAAEDRRPAASIKANGVVGQQGQHIYRVEPQTETFVDPRNVAEARAAFAKSFEEAHFTPKTMERPAPGSFEFTGVTAAPGRPAVEGPYSGDADPPTSDDDLIQMARAHLNNPGRYSFRVVARHDKGKGRTTNVVVAERVVAFLHHRMLDPSPHDHFLPPETDPRFFYKSTFDPQSGAGAKP